MGLDRILDDSGKFVYIGKKKEGEISNNLDEQLKFKNAEQKKEIVELKEHKQELLDRLQTAIVEKDKAEKKIEDGFDAKSEAGKKVKELNILVAAHISKKKELDEEIKELKKEAKNLKTAKTKGDNTHAEALLGKDAVIDELEASIKDLEKQVKDLTAALAANGPKEVAELPTGIDSEGTLPLTGTDSSEDF